MANSSLAQVNTKESLTEEFAGLSAKERTRLAKKEAEEATNDPSFLKLMSEAEGQFKIGAFDEALKLYESARNLRPLNVYPKVKIEDLQALITKLELQRLDSLARVEETTPVLTPAPIDSVYKPIPAPGSPQVVAHERDQQTTPEKPFLPSPIIEEQQAIERNHIKEVDPPVPALPDGQIEQVYREANAIVTERKLTIDGVTTVYRRVVHNWGSTFYFRDGSAITERMWQEVFRER